MLLWFLVAAVFLLDQATKIFVSSLLGSGRSIDFGNIFSIVVVHNPGAAFGVFKNATAFFIFVSFVSILLIIIMLKKKYYTTVQRSALALILGGALGNLADRMRFGYVTDFIDFKIWPVFNIADSAITIGAALLILTIILPKGEKLSKKGKRQN